MGSSAGAAAGGAGRGPAGTVREVVRADVPAPLRGLVAGVTGYRLEGFAPGVHRGLPGRHLTVVLSFGEPLRLALDAGSGAGASSFRAVAAGLDTRPARIEHQGRQAGLQLDLTPAGSRALFGVPAAALAACAVHLEEVLGPAATELAERLAAAGGWPARLQVLDDVLLTVLGRRGAAVRSAQDTPPEVDLAWRRIVASGGAVPVEQLAREVGWSRRHLSERMRRETGLPPKALARLVRFEGVRRELALPVRPPLAQLALKCGYADQAHMTREFTDLAGCSPLRWLAEEELPLLQDGPHANPAGSGHDQ